MAIVTRTAGDANGVNNVDAGRGFLGNIVATGLTKNPVVLKVTLGKGQTFEAADMATGNAVETLLRQIQIDSTVVMYQVDSALMSVVCEAVGSSASAIQTRIQALGNISSSSGNVWANAATVSSSLGFKLSAS